MSKLMIVIASTRPGRAGFPVGQWFERAAREHGGFEVDVVDLLELNLPFLDEPNHPRLRQYTQQHTREWSARVEAADAFAFVTPEYNFSAPPSLVNALDFLHAEWQYKPVGFVSYGGMSGGVRSVQQLKQVVTSLRMFPLYEAVAIPFVAQFIDDEGDVQPNEQMEQTATAMLDELVGVEGALRSLRAESASR